MLLRLLPALALVLAATGCDFGPALDIPTPPFEAGLTINTVLFADSVATVRVSLARDPYATTTTTNVGFGFQQFDAVPDARVTLAREGGASLTLSFVSRSFPTGTSLNGEPITTESGYYVSEARILPGATYTLRAEVPGLPAAEARVRVPERVPAQAEITPLGADRARIALRFRDPPGTGNVYGIDAVQRATFTQTYQFCDDYGNSATCRDTTVTNRYAIQTGFSTSDPTLVANAGGDITAAFATFTDAFFDGEERTLVIETLASRTGAEVSDATYAVRLVALDQPVVSAYRQSYFALGFSVDVGGDNPFQEPSDPVSNVRGGYGLVGAAAITEIAFGDG